MRVINQAGDLAGKRVLVRDDFNVTVDKNGKVLDDFRIRASLPTIEYLLKNQAKVILMAHFGRPQGENFESRIKSQEFSLRPVAERLSELIGKKVELLGDCFGSAVTERVGQMNDGDLVLLENLRFHPEEEANDDEFVKSLAKLGDIYVNDAFGASHRAHASIVKITQLLPSFVGFLLEREVDVLARARDNPEHPLVVVIGGAKISTKIKLIQEFLNKADHIILGGALANTVLHAQGLAIGRSMVELEAVSEVQKLQITNTKLHLPVDVVVSIDKTGQEEKHVSAVGKIGREELILDIGPETQSIFDSVVKSSKMVIWNGPMGLFEVEAFAGGTRAMAESIAACPDCFSIAGGGETTCFLEKFGLLDKFSHVSTGGGAMMEFLAGEKLPGIEVLE
ncbi:MAG: phosphoglycerate kinase [bacterium]